MPDIEQTSECEDEGRDYHKTKQKYKEIALQISQFII